MCFLHHALQTLLVIFPPQSKILAKPQHVNREKWWPWSWSSLLDTPLPGGKFLSAKSNISIFVDARWLWNTVLRELWLDSTVCTGGKAGWTSHWLSRLYCLEIGDMGGCSLLVRTAPRAKLNTPPVSIRSGAIQNHLFLPALSPKLKIFLI